MEGAVSETHCAVRASDRSTIETQASQRRSIAARMGTAICGVDSGGTQTLAGPITATPHAAHAGYTCWKTTARMLPATLRSPSLTPAARCWFAPTPKAAHRHQNNSKPSLRKSDGWSAGNWARRLLMNPGCASDPCWPPERRHRSAMSTRGSPKADLLLLLMIVDAPLHIGRSVKTSSTIGQYNQRGTLGDLDTWFYDLLRCPP